MTNQKSFVEARNGMIEREPKPRERGINYVRAPKTLGQYFADFLTCYGALTDIVKLGTNQLTFIPEDEIKKAIQFSHNHGVPVAIGKHIMYEALRAGSQAARGVIDHAARSGLAGRRRRGSARLSRARAV